jgi:UDP-N-acetyl-D-mannosaminuronic acid dehydrogenase
MKFKTISIIGLGYIGLPTAGMFASFGKKVIGVDVDSEVINKINMGEIHIKEQGLDKIISKAVFEGNLVATNQPKCADAFLITVPTPFKNVNSKIPEPNIEFIKSAAKSIAPVLKKGNLIILESTSPVGTTESLSIWLSEIRSDLSFPHQNDDKADICIAYCPERVMPGNTINELVTNNRIIGGMTPNCSNNAIELYKTFVKGDCYITNSRTAEMVKLTENSCRDVQIAFANELSMICDEIGIDVWELISLANEHPRINILQPGPGVGGHCIAVDPWFIVSNTPDKARLIHTARIVNDLKPEWVINKVNNKILAFLQMETTKTAKEVTIAFYGLTFKPDIDDLRESPALEICKSISKTHSGKVLAVEPNINTLISEKNIELVSSSIAEKEADIFVLLVDHKEFFNNKPNKGIIIDTKGIW